MTGLLIRLLMADSFRHSGHSRRRQNKGIDIDVYTISIKNNSQGLYIRENRAFHFEVGPIYFCLNFCCYIHSVQAPLLFVITDLIAPKSVCIYTLHVYNLSAFLEGKFKYAK
jgi:hypothetical protein